MSRPADDLGTESRGGGSSGRSLFILVLALTWVAASIWMENRVERRLEATESPWRIMEADLPGWLPARSCAILEDIDRIPENVTLRSARWQERVAVALLRSPWIEKVSRVERSGNGIAFAAEFLRPVMAVLADSGYLLVDSTGTVIDLQPGFDLDPAWGVPAYLPQRGALPTLEPGSRIDDPEFEECLSVVRALWSDRVFERWPGELPRIDAYPDGESPGILWRLHSVHGVPLYWGRAPAAPQVALHSVADKLHCLELVLREGPRIRGAGGITLYGDEPTVVDPL